MFKRLLYSFLGLCFGQLFATDAFGLEDIGSRVINRIPFSAAFCSLRFCGGFITNYVSRFTPHVSRIIDIFHLPCVEGSEFTILPLRTQRHTNAIFTVRIDTHRNALLPVDEDLDYALVDEHA